MNGSVIPCSTAFPLKPNTPEVFYCAWMQTKILSWPTRPFPVKLPPTSPNSYWPFLPFGVLNVRFSSATGCLIMLFFPLEELSLFPASHSTSSFHFLSHSNPPLSVQLNCYFHWVILSSFCVLIPYSISSLAEVTKIVIDLGIFCTYLYMPFNKKAHIIWAVGSIFTIASVL